MQSSFKKTFQTIWKYLTGLGAYRGRRGRVGVWARILIASAAVQFHVVHELTSQSDCASSDTWGGDG